MKIKVLSLLLACAMLAGLPIAVSAQEQAGATGQADNRPIVSLPSFAPVVKKAEVAVVNISTVRTLKPQERQLRMQPFSGEEDLFEEFFNRGLPRPPKPQPPRRNKAEAQGSGFIIDPAGYIVTNNHVVEGADEINVKLSSGESIKADIIGRDPKTDLALIKLKKEGTYPYLALGDSSSVQIGDWVVAIGNPLGLDHTVTSGILSARNRTIGAGPYDDFLQTDAAINFGNSGGPLLNLAGEVIGINSAMAAQGTGIGFAIPANLAKGVVEQLKKQGKVVRGWLGIVLMKVTPEFAKYYGLNEPRGAFVSHVTPSGPAAEAKVLEGDIILSFDGQPIVDWNNLPLIVANTEPGKKVRMMVWRDKKEIALNVTVAEMQDDQSGESGVSADAKLTFGMNLKELTPELARQLNLGESRGVLIAGLDPDTLAAESGLAAGDVILKIDNKPVRTLADYKKAVAGKKEGDILMVVVKRGEYSLYFSITME